MDILTKKNIIMSYYSQTCINYHVLSFILHSHSQVIKTKEVLSCLDLRFKIKY